MKRIYLPFNVVKLTLRVCKRPKDFKMTKRNLLIAISLISYGCSKETKKNKELIFSFNDQGYVPSIASKIIDPPSNVITATIQPGNCIDMKLDAFRNQIYISFGAWIVKDQDGGFNSGKLIYNLQSLSLSASHIDIDPHRNRIYWMDPLSRKIYMGSLDGNLTPTPLFGGQPVGSANDFHFSSCTAMALDTKNNILFFSDSTAKKIYKADLNSPTSNPVSFVDTGNSSINIPLDLAVSNDSKLLFWIDKKLSGVWATNTTSNVTTQLFDNGDIDHLYYDKTLNDLYWSSYYGGVWKTNLTSPNWQLILGASYITDFVVND